MRWNCACDGKWNVKSIWSVCKSEPPLNIVTRFDIFFALKPKVWSLSYVELNWDPECCKRILFPFNCTTSCFCTLSRFLYWAIVSLVPTKTFLGKRGRFQGNSFFWNVITVFVECLPFSSDCECITFLWNKRHCFWLVSVAWLFLLLHCEEIGLRSHRCLHTFSSTQAVMPFGSFLHLLWKKSVPQFPTLVSLMYECLIAQGWNDNLELEMS